jgi:uncharacterized protein YjcR
MTNNKKEKEIKKLFKKGFSAEEIAKKLNVKPQKVLKVLKQNFKANKEEDLGLYIKIKSKLKAEIISIYRNNHFYDSFGKILENY